MSYSSRGVGGFMDSWMTQRAREAAAPATTAPAPTTTQAPAPDGPVARVASQGSARYTTTADTAMTAAGVVGVVAVIGVGAALFFGRKRGVKVNRRRVRRNPAAMPAQVRQLKETIEANERKSSKENGEDPLPDPVDVHRHSDGSWAVSDNYERFFNTVFVYRDGQWFTRTLWGDGGEKPYSFEKAMADASMMYTG